VPSLVGFVIALPRSICFRDAISSHGCQRAAADWAFRLQGRLFKLAAAAAAAAMSIQTYPVNDQHTPDS